MIHLLEVVRPDRVVDYVPVQLSWFVTEVNGRCPRCKHLTLTTSVSVLGHKRHECARTACAGLMVWRPRGQA